MSRPKMKDKIRVFERAGWICVSCKEYIPDTEAMTKARRDGKSLWQVGVNHMTVDHIVPRSQGGSDNVLNYVAMCYVCNQKKADTMPNEVVAREGNCCCNFGKARRGDSPDSPCTECKRHLPEPNSTNWMCRRHTRRKAQVARKLERV